jgi:hypothetical protein
MCLPRQHLAYCHVRSWFVSELGLLFTVACCSTTGLVQCPKLGLCGVGTSLELDCQVSLIGFFLKTVQAGTLPHPEMTEEWPADISTCCTHRYLLSGTSSVPALPGHDRPPKAGFLLLLRCAVFASQGGFCSLFPNSSDASSHVGHFSNKKHDPERKTRQHSTRIIGRRSDHLRIAAVDKKGRYET